MSADTPETVPGAPVVAPNGSPLPGEVRARMQDAALRGSVWTLIYSATSLPLNIAVNIAVARLLGPVEYGVVATLTAALAITLAVVNSGVSDATVQWGAGYDAAGDRRSLLDVLRRCSGFHVALQAPVAVAAVLYILRDAGTGVVAAGVVGMAVMMLFGTSAVAQVALNRTANAAQIAMATNIATQVAVLLAAVASHDGQTVWAAKLLVGVVPAVAIMFLVPRDVRHALLRPRWPRRWPPGFVPFAAKTWASGLLAAALYSRSEVFVLQYYGLAEAAGVFALAFGLSYQLTAGVDALVNPLAPAAAGLFSVDRATAVAGLFRALRLMAAATSLVLAVLMPAVAVLIPVIYSSDFGGSQALFVPLAVVSCLQSVAAAMMTFVVAAKRIGAVIAVNLGAFVVDVVVAVLLVPPLGAAGATIASVVSQAVALAGSWWVLRRVLTVTTAPLVAPAAQLVRGSVVGVLLSWAALGPAAHLPVAVLLVAAVVLGLLGLRLSLALPGPRALQLADVELLIRFPPPRVRGIFRVGLRAVGLS